MPHELQAPTEPTLWHRLGRRVWLGSLLMVILLVVYPVSLTLTRVCLLIAILMMWLGFVAWVWHVKVARLAALAIPLFVFVFFMIRSRDVDRAGMRINYVKSLRRYEGTRYIWGGENRVGIDCSGLVREGLIHADIGCGLRTLDPALVREGLFIWWNDCSARELRDGYRNRTRFVLSARGINELDAAQLFPGDLAVTRDGSHVLAYIGDGTWIEADPAVGRVVTAKSPSTGNGWLAIPVNIVRWRQLES